jgi:single-stranded DNA-binding protein
MASDNQITIVGNLTDDPELRYTSNGAAVAAPVGAGSNEEAPLDAG